MHTFAVGFFAHVSDANFKPGLTVSHLITETFDSILSINFYGCVARETETSESRKKRNRISVKGSQFIIRRDRRNVCESLVQIHSVLTLYICIIISQNLQPAVCSSDDWIVRYVMEAQYSFECWFWKVYYWKMRKTCIY